MRTEAGVFTISLDFELYWGVRDKRTLAEYGPNLLGGRLAIPQVLKMFEEFDVRATWAAVGFLFLSDEDELELWEPTQLPKYRNKRFCPYDYICRGRPLDRKYHFAPELLEMIAASQGQEIGTHTFSHYYCLEQNQDLAAFRSDLEAAVEVASDFGAKIRSLVFPRNQWSAEYLPILADLGIDCFRGNEPNWIYRARSEDQLNLAQRGVRLLDAYVDLSGPNTYPLSQLAVAGKPYNLPASRFLRPSVGPDWLASLRIQRIKRAMTHAARTGQMFHLWWHPHNFGLNTERNLADLRQILHHYAELRESYGMRSMNMGELAAFLDTA